MGLMLNIQISITLYFYSADNAYIIITCGAISDLYSKLRFLLAFSVFSVNATHQTYLLFVTKYIFKIVSESTLSFLFCGVKASSGPVFYLSQNVAQRYAKIGKNHVELQIDLLHCYETYL